MRAPGPTAHYLKQPRNQKPLLIRQLNSKLDLRWFLPYF
jgi:hypothetical protein